MRFPEKPSWDTLHQTCVFASVGFVGHVLYSCLFRVRHDDELLFKLEWVWCSFHIERAGTRDAELAYLHLVGFAGHIVHSGASET
jgi:hypothetical protein